MARRKKLTREEIRILTEMLTTDIVGYLALMRIARSCVANRKAASK
jgi:hypothetical protein